MQFFSKNKLSDILKILCTLLIALLGAQIFKWMVIPAPYFLGSLMGVWLVAGSFKKMRPAFEIANWFYLPVIIGICVLIGTNFTPAIFETAQNWLLTVSIMIVATIIVTGIAFQFLTKVKQYEPKQAFLCSIPGGQAEALVIAREMVDKDYIVALFHLVRVAIVFISTPILLTVIEGSQAIQRSNKILQQMPSITELSLTQIGLFMVLCISGYVGAKIIRLPMPHLLGPIFLSSFMHFSGLLELPRIHEFVILAQMTIGASVGARLAHISLYELKSVFFDALLTSAIIMLTYLTVAILITHLAGVSFLSIWLAFVPGGLYEATMLALIFGFDVAFVAFHHLVRVILIFVSMPIFITKFNKK